MEIAPVDEREADLGIDAEAPRGVQPGEPATDDDDAMRQATCLARGTHVPILARRARVGPDLASRGGRYLSRSALARTAWAAASRATGTRNGEHDT